MTTPNAWIEYNKTWNEFVAEDLKQFGCMAIVRTTKQKACVIFGAMSSIFDLPDNAIVERYSEQPLDNFMPEIVEKLKRVRTETISPIINLEQANG
jgi:hypothetical protein